MRLTCVIIVPSMKITIVTKTGVMNLVQFPSLFIHLSDLLDVVIDERDMLIDLLPAFQKHLPCSCQALFRMLPLFAGRIRHDLLAVFEFNCRFCHLKSSFLCLPAANRQNVTHIPRPAPCRFVPVIRIHTPSAICPRYTNSRRPIRCPHIRHGGKNHRIKCRAVS